LRGALSNRVQRQLNALIAAWPERPASFWSRCARVTGWDSLLTCAGRHGVLEVLRPGLLDPRSLLPQAARVWIQRTRQVEQWMDASILDALRDSLHALAAAKVRVVALKGPVLSERLYGDPAARRSTDLDFLVTPDDLHRAAAVFCSLGYQQPRGGSEAFFRTHHHHIHLHAPGRPVVELHFMLSSNFGAAIAATAFLQRAEPFSSRHGPTWVLAPEDELLFLAQHAAGHHFARAAWLYDLKMLLRKYPNLDGALLRRRAKETGIERALQFTLHVLRQRLELDNPLAEEHAARAGPRRWVGDQLLALIDTLPASSLPAKVAGLAYEGLLADRPSARRQLMTRRLASLGVGRRWAAARTEGAESSAAPPG
jgi:hypothetical protein